MKKERNELLEFLGGLAMLVVGLYLFTNKGITKTCCNIISTARIINRLFTLLPNK